MDFLRAISLIIASDRFVYRLSCVVIYFFLSSEKKTDWLLAEARRDNVLGPVVEALELFGHQITHSIFEGNGQYQPYAISSRIEEMHEEFLRQVASGKFKAQFRIGFRHGAGAALFNFLHELIHFWQDMEGRFQIDSYVTLECEAAVESIAAAYRLKKAGYPRAWRGAMGSINWRKMACVYSNDQDTEKLRLIWYDSRQMDFYKKIASQNIASLEGVVSPVCLWKKLKI